jgi:hypothetical protein
MAESIDHIKLVEKAYNYALTLIPQQYTSFIACDHPESHYKPVKTIDGFIPDLYYCYNDFLLIGEAKTDNDFERLHSISQYKSYMREAELFCGESVILVSVSWRIYFSARNLFRRMKRNMNAPLMRVIVISDLGEESII